MAGVESGQVVKGSVFKRCGCSEIIDGKRKQFGSRCPKLRGTDGTWNPAHGGWYYQLDRKPRGGFESEAQARRALNIARIGVFHAGGGTGSGFSWTNLLYRLFDVEGVLLYVGRTNDLRVRFESHAREQWWWGEVARFEIEAYPELDGLVAAEKRAIAEELPRHNVLGAIRRMLTRDELLALPDVIDLETAARGLDISSQVAHRLVRDGLFPADVYLDGNTYRLALADLLSLLGFHNGRPTDQ